MIEMNNEEILDLQANMYLAAKKIKAIEKKESLIPYTASTLRGLWIQGESGSGKDYSVREWCKKENLSLYVKTTKDKFFNEY